MLHPHTYEVKLFYNLFVDYEKAQKYIQHFEESNHELHYGQQYQVKYFDENGSQQTLEFVVLPLKFFNPNATNLGEPIIWWCNNPEEQYLQETIAEGEHKSDN